MKKKAKKKVVKKAKSIKKKKSVTKKRAVVRKAPKRSAAKKQNETQPRPGVIAPKNSVLLGYVEDYFAHVGVIAFTLKKPVSVGARIQVLGHTTQIEQTVDSMQIEHQPVTSAKAGDGIGIKVINRARAGDHVYLMR